MATVVESWMQDNYSKYSIQNLDKFPIYNRFKQIQRPFRRNDGIIQETYKIVEDSRFFEWTNESKKSGEKIGFDSRDEIWFYEHWFPEVNCFTVVKTWYQLNSTEWGKIIRYFQDRQEIEIWKVDEHGGQHYEKLNKRLNRKQGNKYWFSNHNGHRSESMERFWQDEDEEGFEKQWKTPMSVGSEHRQQRGTSVRGRFEVQESDYYEVKEYNEEGQRSWGKSEGKRNQTTWNEKWDISPIYHMEDKVFTEGDSRWGNRYRKKAGVTIKEEWVGSDRLDDDCSGPCECTQELRQIYDQAKLNAADSQRTLNQLGKQYPQYKSRINQMDVQRVSVTEPNWGNEKSLSQAIGRLQQLQQKQEQLKFEIIVNNEKIELEFEFEEEVEFNNEPKGIQKDLIDNLIKSDKTITQIIKNFQTASKPAIKEQKQQQNEIEKAKKLALCADLSEDLVVQCSDLLKRQEDLKQFLVNSPNLSNMLDGMLETEADTTDELTKQVETPEFVEKARSLPQEDFKEKLDKLTGNVIANNWLSKLINGEQIPDDNLESAIDNFKKKAGCDAENVEFDSENEDDFDQLDNLMDRHQGKNLVLKHMRSLLNSALGNTENEVQQDSVDPQQLQKDAQDALQSDKFKKIIPALKKLIDNSQVMPKNSEGDLDDIDMMEDLEISNVTLTKPANSKAKGVMAGRPEVMTVNMELSQPSGFDLDPLVEQINEGSKEIDEVIEQFDFLPEDHGLDVRNAELNSYIQTVNKTANQQPKEAYDEILRILKEQEKIRKDLYSYVHFEEEEIVEEFTETSQDQSKKPSHSQKKVIEQEYTLPTIPLHLIVNAINANNDEIHDIIDKFAYDQNQFNERLYPLVSKAGQVAKMNEEGEKEDKAVELAAQILDDQKKLREDILKTPEIDQKLKELNTTQSEVLEKLQKELHVPDIAQITSNIDQDPKNYVDKLDNQNKKSRILLALVKKLIGDDFDDGDYDDVQEIVNNVEQRKKHENEQDPTQTLKSCVNQSIQIADNLLQCQEAEEPHVLHEIKEEVQNLTATPEISKLAEILFNLHSINGPLAAQLADESELQLPEITTRIKLPLKPLSQLPKVKKSKLIPVDTSAAKQAVENSLQVLDDLINLASKPQTERQKDLIETGSVVLQQLDENTPYCGNWALVLLAELEKEQSELLDEVKQAQNPQLLVKLISLINRGAKELSDASSDETKDEIDTASDDWQNGKGSELGYLKYFTNLLVKVIGDNKNKTQEEYEEEWAEFLQTTQKQRTPKVPKQSSIDTDSLLNKYKAEQKLEIPILKRLVAELGNSNDNEQVNQFETESKELGDYAGNELVDRYADLRTAQTKFEDNLLGSLKLVGDRLRELDALYDVNIRRVIGQVQAKVKPGEHEQELAYFRETYAKFDQRDEDGQDDLAKIMKRILQRGKLYTDVQTFVDDLQPSDESESQMIQNLRDIETKGYNSAFNVYKALKKLGEQIGNEDQKSNIEGLKGLSEIQGSNNTVPALVSSINVALGNIDQICDRFKAILSEGPLQYILQQLIKGINDFNQKDIHDTNYVFSGLFKLSGDDNDKEAARKFEQERNHQVFEKEGLLGLAEVVQENIDAILPARGKQSDLQRKLINQANNIRDSYDQVDLQRDELLKKVMRDTGSLIQPNDKASKGQFEGLRKQLQELDQDEYTTFSQLVNKALKRVVIWENVEALRRKLKENIQKQLALIKEQLTEQTNLNQELEASKQSMEQRLNGQLQYVQQNLDAATNMAEKLGSDCNEKELQLSKLQNELKNLNDQVNDQEQKINELNDEVEEAAQDLQKCRKAGREKDNQIRDLQEQNAQLEAANQKAFAGDSEKEQAIQKMLGDLKEKQQELNEAKQVIYDLEQQVQETNRNNDVLQQEKDDLINKLKNNDKKLQESNAKIVRLEADLLELQTNQDFAEQNNNLEQLLEEKEQVIEELQGYLDNFRKYQALYEDAKDSNKELQEQNRKLDIELSDLQLEVEALQGDQKRNAPKLAQLPELQSRLQDLEGQNITLKNKLAASQSGGQKENEVLDKMNQDINERDREIYDLKQTVDKLTGDIGDLKDRFINNKKRSCLILFTNAIKQLMKKHLLKWYYISQQPQVLEEEEEVVSRSYLTTTRVSNVQNIFAPAPDADMDIEIDEPITIELRQSYVDAEQGMQKDYLKLLEDNILMRTMRESQQVKGAKPMTYQNVFKFFENMMDRKFEVDKRDIEDKRVPRTMTEFLMEYLQRQFGIQAIALQNLGKLIPTLYQLYQEGHPYGVLFCRLLQIFHADPVPYNLSVYLTKVRMDFAPLEERATKIRQGGKAVSHQARARSGTFGKASYDYAATGGEAFLTDVVDMVTGMFSVDKAAGKQVVKQLKPDNVTIDDFVIFLISHRMVKLGVTPDDIFQRIDADGGGTLDSNELLQGLRDNLDIMLPDQTITQAIEQMMPEGQHEISRADFVKRINVGVFMKNQRSDDYLVTKCRFLTSLIEAYHFIQLRDAANLRLKLKDTKSPINQEEFIRILISLDSSLEPDKCLDFFQDWSNEEDQTFDLGSIVQFIVRNGIGGYGLSIFAISELTHILKARKQVVDIDIDSAGTGSSRVIKKRTVIEEWQGSGDEEEIVTTRRTTIKRGKKKVVKK